MKRLLLIDGMNLLFQMFYGMPSRLINSRGKAIQGTLGFVGALLKIIRMIEPTHVVELFDGECKSTRAEIDPEYKANRPDFEGMDENDIPFSQLPDVYAALDHLGIKHTETEGCETDDVIASYAITYGGEYEVVISSFDSSEKTAESAFGKVFLLCSNAALIVLKSVASSSGFIGFSLWSFILITVESTFGSGTNLSERTTKSFSAVA